MKHQCNNNELIKIYENFSINKVENETIFFSNYFLTLRIIRLKI